jgi:hypothetical protein
MRGVAGAVTVVTLVLAGTSLINAQKQLALLATVTDPAGGEAVTLDPKDVRVTENDQLATIVRVEPVQRVPKLQVLIDNGLGIPSESIGDLRKGLTAFLEALPNTLEVSIFTTAPQPRMLEKPTTDKIKLLQAVNRLTPDTSAGRFVESLAEAVDRIDKDKQEDASYTIFTLGTTSGDNNVRDNDLKKIMQGIQARKTTVHAAILSKTTSGGRIQLDVGQAAAGASGGRFEIINVPNRIVSLLPEYAAQIAKASGPGAKQFRITFDRPGGAAGDLGRVGISVDGKLVSGVTLDRPAVAKR